MSKRSRVERAQFRGELLGVLREQVVVLRRVAAVLEREATVHDITKENEHE